jgi:hypothetical protein
MRTKNAARITAAESAHMQRVKSSGCVTCDAGPYVAAHHIQQGDHYTVIGLCGSRRLDSAAKCWR